MRSCLFLLAVTVLLLPATGCQVDRDVSVIIYGGTSAGVSAAVQASRMGKSVILIEPGQHVGGLSCGGLGWTDVGNATTIGGISLEFYQRVFKYYEGETAWTFEKLGEYITKVENKKIKPRNGIMSTFEPHAAEEIFNEMLSDVDIEVILGERLDRTRGVKKKKDRIQQIIMESGRRFVGEIFIDATYEGDLMAAAGVSYHVGREANNVYDENWNGIQVGVLHHSHYFKTNIDPYIIPGDPSSGLLPRISNEDPGVKGQGDHRIQAYCFRMCLTDHDDNRVPFPKPKSYDESQYELLLRVFETGLNSVFKKFDPLPNRKTDTNNHGPFSTDNIGMNYDYPEASYERRQEIIKEHETYQKGLMYFLANDPRVPEDIRTKMSKWGLAKDEFVDNGHWPHQLYIREARRMIGEYVMTENDILTKRDTPDSVGMGSYTMDSHNVQRYVTGKGYVQNEGDIGVKVPAPYKIAYLSLTPKKNECINLLVPVCLSSSHIAYGSIRMEPVFLILGQSAATAACIAIDGEISVQEVDYQKLKRLLLTDNQKLEPKR
jgi:hypothetical protein